MISAKPSTIISRLRQASLLTRLWRMVSTALAMLGNWSIVACPPVACMKRMASASLGAPPKKLGDNAKNTHNNAQAPNTP